MHDKFFYKKHHFTRSEENCLLHFPGKTSRCCSNSARTCIIKWGGGRLGGQWDGKGEVTRVSEMDSNDNLICLHMKPLFPIFPICLFPWAQCEESDAMLHRILSFQLRPLSLLLSTAAASTANLHSIIFQTELELKSQSAADLKL